MIGARQNVAVYAEQLECVPASAEELAVFVQDDRMAESVAKLDFHDG